MENFGNPALNGTAVSKNPNIISLLPTATAYSNPWKGLGPTNYGGKVMDVAIYPEDEDIIYVAYTYGGIWKTTDGGTTWEQLNERSRNNMFSSVRIWAQDPNTVFAGLGAPYETFNADEGILKTIDGGVTWEAIGPDLPETTAIYRIEIDYNDVNTVYAATTSAVYKTTDGGQQWYTILEYEGTNWWPSLPDMAMHPTNANVLYVAQASIGIKMTSDGGTSWQDRSSGVLESTTPLLIAFAPSDPNIMYVEREGTFPAIHVYRSENGGATWIPKAVLNDFHQGRFDMSIAVHPEDPDRVTIGNVYLYESDDGAESFEITPFSVGPHGDHLKIIYPPSNPTIAYSGNDGGLWRRTEDVSGITLWDQADFGVQTTLSFSIGLDLRSERIYSTIGDYAGAFVYTGSASWTYFPGWSTEWNFFFVDPYDSRLVYYGLLDWGLYRSDVGPNGLSPSNHTPIDPDLSSPRRPHWSRVRFHPTVEGTIYYGTNKLFKSADRGQTWETISPVLPENPEWPIMDFSVAPSNPEIIYVISTNEYKIYKTEDGGVSWSSVSSPAIFAWTIESSPVSADTFYVGARQGVFLVTDHGTNIQAINGNLPDIRVDKIAIDPQFSTRIYVGTPYGVFLTDDGGTTWDMLGTGLPRNVIWDMGSRHDGLYVAGPQGVWRYDLSTTAFSPPLDVELVVPLNNALNQPATVDFTWQGQALASTYNLQTSTIQDFSSLVFDESSLFTVSTTVGPLNYATEYYWRVRASNRTGTGLWSKTWSFTTVVSSPSALALTNPPNGAINQPSTTTLSWEANASAVTYHVQVSQSPDFTSIVFDDSTLTDISTEVGPLAYSTDHYWRVRAKNTGGSSPWSEIWSFTTVVSAPAALALTNPPDGAVNQPSTITLSWEANASAATYHLQVSTSMDFTSLVADDSTLTDVSTDVGPLAYSTEHYWRVRAKNAGGTGPWSDVRGFIVAVGTTVEVMDGEIPSSYELYQNYPNPFNSVTTIEFDLPDPARVRLTVYDLLGREITSLAIGRLLAGRYRYSWDASGFSSGIYVYRLTAGTFTDTGSMLLTK